MFFAVASIQPTGSSLHIAGTDGTPAYSANGIDAPYSFDFGDFIAAFGRCMRCNTGVPYCTLRGLRRIPPLGLTPLALSILAISLPAFGRCMRRNTGVPYCTLRWLGAGISSLLTDGSSKKRVAPECTKHQMSVEGVMSYIGNRPNIQKAQSWSGSFHVRHFSVLKAYA